MSFTIRGSTYLNDKSHINNEFDNYVEYSKKSNIPSREAKNIEISINPGSLIEENLTLRVELYARDMNANIVDNINAYISNRYVGKVRDCKLIHSYKFSKGVAYDLAINNFDKKILNVNVVAKTFMLKKDDVVQMILSVSEQKASHTYAICTLKFDKSKTEFIDKKVVIDRVEYIDNTYVYVKINVVNLVDGIVILCEGEVVPSAN